MVSLKIKSRNNTFPKCNSARRAGGKLVERAGGESTESLASQLDIALVLYRSAAYHQRQFADRDLSCFDAYGRERRPFSPANTIAAVMPFQIEKNRFLASFSFCLNCEEVSLFTI